jgi:N,N'-diacetyllegionaminate synthase
MVVQRLGEKMKKLSDHGFKTENKTYVIAEIGINHGGNLDVAKRLIDSASKTGCDAVKFQTYKTELRAPKGNHAIFDMLKKCELPFSNFEVLKNHAQGYGLDFFSTPFDDESVDYLESINTDLYKVASFDIVNKALLRKIATTGKPVIMSVGMSNLSEIEVAYDIFDETNNLSLLHCVSAYPTNEVDANLAAISVLKSKFPKVVVGQSDHTSGIKVPLYAVALGAQIIEKHYRIDDKMDCIDAPVSISEQQMSDLVSQVRELEVILGEGRVSLSDVEKNSTIFRRFT